MSGDLQPRYIEISGLPTDAYNTLYEQVEVRAAGAATLVSCFSTLSAAGQLVYRKLIDRLTRKVSAVTPTRTESIFTGTILRIAGW